MLRSPKLTISLDRQLMNTVNVNQIYLPDDRVKGRAVMNTEQKFISQVNPRSSKRQTPKNFPRLNSAWSWHCYCPHPS